MSTNPTATPRFIRVSTGSNPGGASFFHPGDTTGDYSPTSAGGEHPPVRVNVATPQSDGSTRSQPGLAIYTSEGGKPRYVVLGPDSRSTLMGNAAYVMYDQLWKYQRKAKEGQTFTAAPEQERERDRTSFVDITGPRIVELASNAGDDESIASASDSGSDFGDDESFRGRTAARARRAQTPAPPVFRSRYSASVASESEDGDGDTSSEVSLDDLNERGRDRDTNDSSPDTNNTSSFWSRLSSLGKRIGILTKDSDLEPTPDTPGSSDNLRQFFGDGTGVNALGAFPGTIPTPAPSSVPPVSQPSTFTFSNPTPTPQSTTIPSIFGPPPPPPPPPPLQPTTTSAGSTGQPGRVRSFLSNLWSGMSTPSVEKQREPVSDSDNPTIYDLIRSDINPSFGLASDAPMSETFATFIQHERQRQLASQFSLGLDQGNPSFGQSTYLPSYGFGQSPDLPSSQGTIDPRLASLLAARQAQAQSFSGPGPFSSGQSSTGYPTQTQGAPWTSNPGSDPRLANLMAQLRARQATASGVPGIGQF